MCAGEALWNVDERGSALRFRPGGGAARAALALARQGLSVGLATVLRDDTLDRSLLAKVAACGVDVGGVELARRERGLLLVTGGARQLVPFREEEQPITVPPEWQSQVLLLSGMSPVVAHGAALCRAARAARRAGTTVVVDINARWSLWQGRDPRSVRMILREADVVWCSAEDLFGLGLDAVSVRAALRDAAVLVTSDGAGTARASGPFGEVARALREKGGLGDPLGAGETFTAAICAELARTADVGQGGAALWARALDRGLRDATARS